MSGRRAAWALLLVALTAGCDPGVSATNPYDPSAPAEQQRPATVVGHLELPSGFEARAPEALVALVREGAPAQSTDVDPGGSFALERVTPGAYDVAVTLAGFRASPVAVEVVAGERLELPPLRLRLVPAAQAKIRGEVRRDDGGPVAGVVVEVVGTPARVVSEAGDFALPAPPGPALLRARLRGFAEATEAVELSPGEERTLDSPLLLVARPGRVVGTLVAPTGFDPSRLREVVVQRLGGEEVADQTSPASDGFFALADVPAGAWRLRVEGVGLATLERALTVAPGERLDLGRLTLERQDEALGRIRGEVRLEGGASPEFTRVEL